MINGESAKSVNPESNNGTTLQVTMVTGSNLHLWTSLLLTTGYGKGHTEHIDLFDDILSAALSLHFQHLVDIWIHAGEVCRA